ncbi:RagB/SusD family nutrient uptake outer membrane protein [Pedobacter nyackensis]|uniref:RagB/SusD family nutrient uptake outer membrane protein n=1 Tax=Pedobacter nyackensis TaxID=475255 RepID=UPI00292FEFC1|nr:RagB/SusD family nutrient uptake outer membrane protein [Pedobacter nyackensis]
MKKLFYMVALSSLTLLSCSKFLEIDLPNDKQTSESVFSSNETAQAATVGIYARSMRFGNSYFNGITTISTGLLAGEILPKNLVADNMTPYLYNDMRSDLSNVSLLWAAPYEIIYHCNLVIEKLVQSDAVSADLKQRLIAEAKFFRALHYFYLINVYGEVPLALTSDYQTNAILPKSKASEVYAAIINDLEQAEQNLSDDYYSAERIRANKWAAKALLARVHLYLENWTEAERYAREVIGHTSQYKLAANANDAFLNSNNEAIFQLSTANNNTVNCYDGSIFLYVNNTKNPDYYIREGLLDVLTLDPKDERKNWALAQTATDGTTYHLLNKYKVRAGVANAKKIEHLTLLRLGEQYLILAEALAHQSGKLIEAVENIDIIRVRAKVDPLKAPGVTYTQDQVLDMVMDERQKELCFELGHRWFDLNRTGRAAAYFATFPEKNWQPTDRFFPIPAEEVLDNPFLKQNPGYQ